MEPARVVIIRQTGPRPTATLQITNPNAVVMAFKVPRSGCGPPDAPTRCRPLLIATFSWVWERRSARSQIKVTNPNLFRASPSMGKVDPKGVTVVTMRVRRPLGKLRRAVALVS